MTDPNGKSLLSIFDTSLRDGEQAPGFTLDVNAKVAMARKLGVRLYWMWRKGWDYEQLRKFGSHAGPARTSRWCEVEHRVIDWAARSSSSRSSK